MAMAWEGTKGGGGCQLRAERDVRGETPESPWTYAELARDPQASEELALGGEHDLEQMLEGLYGLRPVKLLELVAPVEQGRGDVGEDEAEDVVVDAAGGHGGGAWRAVDGRAEEVLGEVCQSGWDGRARSAAGRCRTQEGVEERSAARKTARPDPTRRLAALLGDDDDGRATNHRFSLLQRPCACVPLERSCLTTVIVDAAPTSHPFLVARAIETFQPAARSRQQQQHDEQTGCRRRRPARSCTCRHTLLAAQQPRLVDPPDLQPRHALLRRPIVGGLTAAARRGGLLPALSSPTDPQPCVLPLLDPAPRRSR